jgi:hypothetical protein
MAAKKKPIVAHIVIEGRKFRDFPEALHAEPSNRLTFVFHNLDNTDWDVHILDIKEKEPKTAAMPLKDPIGPAHSVTAKKNDVTIMRQRVEDVFAKGSALPFTTYKYTLRLTDVGGGGANVDLDPDLDIAPPN